MSFSTVSAVGHVMFSTLCFYKHDFCPKTFVDVLNDVDVVDVLNESV